jgi:hypothetical protein
LQGIRKAGWRWFEEKVEEEILATPKKQGSWNDQKLVVVVVWSGLGFQRTSAGVSKFISATAHQRSKQAAGKPPKDMWWSYWSSSQVGFRKRATGGPRGDSGKGKL